jgi:diguanylate cyclase (GGDEF)-like protein
MAAAYVINPPLRGMLLMLVALILVFAAFTLSPGASRALGWFAVALLGLVMLAMATHAPQVYDPTIERIHFVFAAVVLPVISMLAGDLSAMRTRLKLQKAELQEALARIHKLATRDDLTGLINRRHMEELAAMEQRRAQRSGGLPCLCLVDIDHFKRVNDLHGHAAGDEVLRLFARHAAASMRETDVLARWGGEEFLVMLPDTRPEEARVGFERLKRVLSRDDAWGAQVHMRVSFSAGLTAWRSDEPLRDALARADRALYEAKASGRDRLIER